MTTLSRLYFRLWLARRRLDLAGVALVRAVEALR